MTGEFVIMITHNIIRYSTLTKNIGHQQINNVLSLKIHYISDKLGHIYELVNHHQNTIILPLCLI